MILLRTNTERRGYQNTKAESGKIQLEGRDGKGPSELPMRWGAATGEIGENLM